MTSAQPPWQVVVLVSDLLDPKTLAAASCACTSWCHVMSSDRLWAPLCAAEFPSLSLLASAGVPPRRLYALGRAAAARRLRLRSPPKPRLSLSDLVLAVTVSTVEEPPSPLASSVTPCCDAEARCGGGVFAFDVRGFSAAAAAEEEARVTWSVAVRGWGGIVTVVDGGVDGWLTAELPAVAGRGSGMAAEAKVVVFGSEIERVSLGILDVVNWRYVTVDDALRYLQHFLLPLHPHHSTIL